MKTRELIRSFECAHSFSVSPRFRGDETAIAWLEEIRIALAESVSRHVERLESGQDRTWAILASMVDRIYELTAGAVVSFFTGGWAAMEVVVRAIMEATATVLYVASGNREQRVGEYLGWYFSSTRTFLERLPKAEVVDAALEMLSTREELISEITRQEGIVLLPGGWPRSVRDRFRAAGMEEDYDHLYSALSSQAHNDADSLIDYLVLKCVKVKGVDCEEAAVGEVIDFMRTLLLSGIGYYSRAALAYSEAFTLSDATERIRDLRLDICVRRESLARGFETWRAQVSRSCM